jgi:hypothetical protein
VEPTLAVLSLEQLQALALLAINLGGGIEVPGRRALLILPIPEQQVLSSNPSVGSTPAPNGRMAGECPGSSD